MESAGPSIFWHIKLVVSVMLLSLLSSNYAKAEVGRINSSPDLPVSFSAGEVHYDREAGVITATSNVEVSHDGSILLADSLSYNQLKDTLVVKGNVSLLDPSGDVYFASSMRLSSDLKNGVAEDLRALFADKSRLAAVSAQRKGGVVSEWDKAVYTPCKPCEEDPKRAPLWQLKAVKVIHNKNEKIMEYKDAWLELAGVPVFYTPYFRFPDATVKRKTGFLMPSWQTSTTLGQVYKTPVYLDIASDKGATLTPIVTTKAGSGVAAKYDQLLAKGKVSLAGSMIQDKDKSSESGDLNDGKRWHFSGNGVLHLDETWRTGVEINRVSDGSYFGRYGLAGEGVQKSRIYAEGFRKKNYFSASAYDFQDIRSESTETNIPLIFPFLEYSHEGNPGRFGQKQTLDASFVALTRESERDVNRLSVKGGWEIPFLTSGGSVYNLSASIRADGYSLNNHVTENGKNADGVVGRIFPQASLEWRYPMARDEGSTYQVFEPIASAVVSPNGGNPDEIPNEDSLGFELDDTNLFDSNRYPGVDRVEGGSRLNYGLKWGIYGQNGGKTTAFVGQSYRVSRESSFSKPSGLKDNFSDIVGRLNISPRGDTDIYYRTRLDKDDLSFQRNELGASTKIKGLSLGLNYAFFEENIDSGFSGREELSVFAGRKISEYWRGDANMLYDMSDDGGLRSLGLSFSYDDECLLFSLGMARSYFENNDVKPESSVTVLLTLKFPGGSLPLSPYFTPYLNKYILTPYLDQKKEVQ